MIEQITYLLFIRRLDELDTLSEKKTRRTGKPERLETTGFVPERTDRVVEVGIVLADKDGQIEHEWSTLVNPHRDISASFIHHIVGADLLDAPDFADISGHVLELLTDRVVLAHNAVFDMRFLQCELQRADYVVPKRPAALCSMKWAGRVFGAAKQRRPAAVRGLSVAGSTAPDLACRRGTSRSSGHAPE